MTSIIQKKRELLIRLFLRFIRLHVEEHCYGLNTYMRSINANSSHVNCCAEFNIDTMGSTIDSITNHFLSDKLFDSQFNLVSITTNIIGNLVIVNMVGYYNDLYKTVNPTTASIKQLITSKYNDLYKVTDGVPVYTTMVKELPVPAVNSLIQNIISDIINVCINACPSLGVNCDLNDIKSNVVSSTVESGSLELSNMLQNSKVDTIKYTDVGTQDINCKIVLVKIVYLDDLVNTLDDFSDLSLEDMKFYEVKQGGLL